MGERHIIWEIVDHMTFWLNEVNKYIRDMACPNTQLNDWIPMGELEKEWEESVNGLEYAVNMLIGKLDEWTNEDMEKVVPGANYNFRQMLHGALHHNLYHSGQIALLKKMVS